MRWWDVLERAFWTFVEGALATHTITPIVFDVSAWKVFVVSAATGGVAALYSFLKTVAQERLSLYDTRETAR